MRDRCALSNRSFTVLANCVFRVCLVVSFYVRGQMCCVFEVERMRAHNRVCCSDCVSMCWCACLLVGCLTSQQQASVSQGRICSDKFTCCHTEIEVADQTFNLTQSQYIDTGPTSPSADPITPGAWQGSHWNANV